MDPFTQASDSLRLSLSQALATARALLVTAQEENVASPQGGMTSDEAQAEVAANVQLVVRSIEDAMMRTNVAKHTFVGDSTLYPSYPGSGGGFGAAPAITSISSQGQNSSPAEDQSEAEENQAA